MPGEATKGILDDVFGLTGQGPSMEDPTINDMLAK